MRRTMLRPTRLLLASLAAAALAAAPALATGAPAPEEIGPLPPPATDSTPRADMIARGVRLEQKLNAQIPTQLGFRDEAGKTVHLSDYLGRRPVMLNLIQYRCTMLCSTEMAILSASLKRMKFTVGNQFDVVTVSIDPREQSMDLASDYKAGYVKDYGRPGAERGWHFLTGSLASIEALADAVGYHYYYVPEKDQFAHPDGVIILTPEGKISKYFFRLNYAPDDLRLALVEAGQHKIGSPLDALALLCYHYDPTTGRYSLAVLQVVRLLGLTTVLGLALCIGLMNLHHRGARRRGGDRANPALPRSEA